MTILAGKVVVVTGGASGIGRSIAVRAAQLGASAVVIGDLDEAPKEGGETTALIVEKHGASARFLKCDVRSHDDLAALIAVADQFGGVDVMVCNAGVALASDGPEITDGDFDKLVSINLHGALKSAQHAGAAMKARATGGSIVVISSMGGLRGSGFNLVYTMTKGGVNMMTASLADAFGPEGIRVNAVCPGLINTRLIESSPGVAAAAEGLRQRMPLRRLGEPDEIGDVVAWLGSDLSSFVTGAVIPVDGGQTAVI
ncbi:SDR family oxidoreductase [Agrobacterium vitis]|uniref:Glucose 1-dehydrogenase n=1 Tax=Agrobacterium vitis TaxID=373 RepID=A0AAE4WAK1_AGRVI|nr:SDR family oxidoreductase [Agrobacterium vitis]MCF1501753.1 SDR family oxidoreductase [Allorhizobium sp. Av2]MCM2438740.1 SDR family oxidoreductase [Agrobacterium vitis]MUZ56981.1 glucose 1-dehydrogenase [Agrobacterium vitis]MVA69159.1 glucose 1-dehydrogenase [Agrobacterium vitis]MVA85883.1 glucose 1-dehydrogenase [Agrobacterium vitis]